MSNHSRIINKCIYCLSDNDLHKEHILPYSINGNHILYKACCPVCQEIINNEIETPINQKFFKLARSFLKLQSRSKRYLETIQLSINGEKKEIKISDIGVPLSLPEIDTTKKEICTNLYYTHIKPPKTQVEEGEYKFNTEINYLAFCRYLTKVAYGYTILSKGLNQFNEDISNYILGRSDKLPVIKTLISKEKLINPQEKVIGKTLHKITLIPIKQFKTIVVKLQFFVPEEPKNYPSYLVFLDDKSTNEVL
jgi:hypothetical protein